MCSFNLMGALYLLHRGENLIYQVRELRRNPQGHALCPSALEAPLLVLERVEPPPERFRLRRPTYAVGSQQVNDLHHTISGFRYWFWLSDTPLFVARQLIFWIRNLWRCGLTAALNSDIFLSIPVSSFPATNIRRTIRS